MHIAIIGNGISGITAARFIRKLSDHDITVISSESKYFYSRTALMYIYMGHMRLKDTQPYENSFWAKNRIAIRQEHVDSIDFSSAVLNFESGEKMTYDKLIIATGSSSNKFGWPGQDLEGVHGLYNLQDLEAMERHTPGLQRAVVVGGGLIGIEMAEMFHSRQIPVTMLVRESSYWNNVLPLEESQMISRHIAEHGIDLRLQTELKEISGNENGKVNSITTHTGEQLHCGFVGLTAGVHPNVAFLKNTELEINRGVLVNNHLQTSIPNVYAIGDCAEILSPRPGRRAVEAVWYTGRMMGETVAYNICGQPVKYDPGLWFNSAKFLDIEYQVYGDIPSNRPDHISTLYWEHSDGNKSIRINFRREDQAVTGFNLMGVRFRHEVCEKWILSQANIEHVLAHLPLASFDPEFFKEHHHDVLQQYNQQFNRKIALKTDGKLNKVLQFLKG